MTALANSKRILILTKRPTGDRLDEATIARLDASGVLDRASLTVAAEAHHHSLSQVLSDLRGHQTHCVPIDQLTLAMTRDIDLAISVGGDGSVLAMHPYLDRVPLLAVNSDEQRSVGHFTRTSSSHFADVWQAWQQGCHGLSLLPRLNLTLGGESFRMLNDCLITTTNPGMMSRYRLIIPNSHAEMPGSDYADHWSSGLWISTAAGSSAAIHSAGFPEILPPTHSALCWQVREPFHGRQQQRLISGMQQPPQRLTIIPAIPGMACYIDGGHIQIDIPAGEPVTIEACPEPLQLIEPAPPS